MARIPKNILAFNFYDFIPSPPYGAKEPITMEGTLRGLKSSKYEATWAVNDETLGEFSL